MSIPILIILKYKNYWKIQNQINKKITHIQKIANKIDLQLINRPF